MDSCEGGGEDDDVVDLRVGTSRNIRVCSAKVMGLNPRERIIGLNYARKNGGQVAVDSRHGAENIGGRLLSS